MILLKIKQIALKEVGAINYKRVTLLAGHYGSGKTNLAVNLALEMAKKYPMVIGDLDIVNPYYRTKDSKEVLEKAGIDLIASPYANTNLDIPAIPAEFYRITNDKSVHAILDVGGDDQGAVALGRYVPALLEENDFDMLFVANFRRPLTPTAEDALEVMREIEAACGLKFTGIINNTNLGNDTTAETIIDSMGECEKLSRLSNLPILRTGVIEKLAEELAGKVPEILPLKLQPKIF